MITFKIHLQHSRYDFPEFKIHLQHSRYDFCEFKIHLQHSRYDFPEFKIHLQHSRYTCNIQDTVFRVQDTPRYGFSMFFVRFMTVFAIKMRAKPPAEVRRTMCDGFRAKNNKIRANNLPRLNYARTQGTGAASLHPSGLVCAYPSHGCLPALPHRWHALNSEPDMHPVRGRASSCAA